MVFIKRRTKMKEIIKHLRKSWKAIILIITLLAVQAICDLSLPDYTSRIINIGVQQGGIDSTAPEVMSKSTMEDLLLLLDTKEQKEIKDAYKLIEKKKLSKKEYQKYQKKYEILEKENIYILKNGIQKENISKILEKK